MVQCPGKWKCEACTVSRCNVRCDDLNLISSTGQVLVDTRKSDQSVSRMVS